MSKEKSIRPASFAEARVYEDARVIEILDRCIQITAGETDFVTLTVIYSLFKELYRYLYPRYMIPTRRMVNEALKKKLRTSQQCRRSVTICNAAVELRERARRTTESYEL